VGPEKGVVLGLDEWSPLAPETWKWGLWGGAEEEGCRAGVRPEPARRIPAKNTSARGAVGQVPLFNTKRASMSHWFKNRLSPPRGGRRGKVMKNLS